MSEKLITVGHIVEDTAEPENVIGGGVSYSGITAKELGLDVHIITKFPTPHRFLDSFAQRGITIMTLPTRSDEVTRFTNRYDTSGNRKQVLSGRQESITLTDLESVPSTELDASCILVAPVIGEVDTNVIPRLAAHGLVAVTPQGYFREIREDGTIFQKEWQGFEKDLSYAFITILSDEDIAVKGVLNDSLLDRIKSSSSSVVLTRGKNGATVFDKGRKAFDVQAFPLTTEQTRDFTGAGDTFAAAYIAKFMKTGNHHAATVFASLVAGIKITGSSGVGIDSIPKRRQIEQFLEKHSSQLKRFLTLNQASEDFINF